MTEATEAIIDLFEDVVKRTWQEEKAFSKSLFKTELEENEPYCQGIARGVFHKIFGTFPNSFQAEFLVNEKPHIVVYVANGLHSYVIDGTIKQFLPEEKRTAFLLRDYPFKKEIQFAKRRIT